MGCFTNTSDRCCLYKNDVVDVRDILIATGAAEGKGALICIIRRAGCYLVRLQYSHKATIVQELVQDVTGSSTNKMVSSDLSLCA